MSFYKFDQGRVFVAPNSVKSSEYELLATNKDSYTYPVHGWYWFDTDEAAEAALATTDEIKKAFAALKPAEAQGPGAFRPAGAPESGIFRQAEIPEPLAIRPDMVSPETPAQ
jgi:hypothetical protein